MLSCKTVFLSCHFRFKSKQNLYAVLGVNKDATTDDIKRAFLSRSKEVGLNFVLPGEMKAISARNILKLSFTLTCLFSNDSCSNMRRNSSSLLPLRVIFFILDDRRLQTDR